MSRAPEQPRDPLRWCAALALVFWLACLPHLTAVPHAYFDEVHYLPAARELLALDEFTNREHPPFAKQLLALSVLVIDDTPLGWRVLPVVAGTAALFASMRALWFATLSRFATPAGDGSGAPAEPLSRLKACGGEWGGNLRSAWFRGGPR